MAGPEFASPALSDYLSGLLNRRGISVREVADRCNLERSYSYQLFNGTRRPTRNFLLRLALLLELPEEEAQRMLKIAQRPPLYARNRRDAAVLYALSHHLTGEQADGLLRDLREEELA